MAQHESTEKRNMIFCTETQDVEFLSGTPVYPESEDMTLSCGGCGEVDPEVTEPTPEPQPVWAMPMGRELDPTWNN